MALEEIFIFQFYSWQIKFVMLYLNLMLKFYFNMIENIFFYVFLRRERHFKSTITLRNIFHLNSVKMIQQTESDYGEWFDLLIYW